MCVNVTAGAAGHRQGAGEAFVCAGPVRRGAAQIATLIVLVAVLAMAAAIGTAALVIIAIPGYLAAGVPPAVALQD